MTPFAEVTAHVANDITLLCGTHHDQTKGNPHDPQSDALLPEEVVREKNRAPVNIAKGYTRPFELYFRAKDFELPTAVIGGNPFSLRKCGTTPVISIDDHDLVSFRTTDSGELFLSMDVRDEHGEQLLKIDDNELCFKSDFWDITFINKTLTLSQGPRNIQFKITFEPPTKIVITHATFQRNGRAINVQPGAIFGDDFLYCGNKMTGIGAGLVFGKNARNLHPAGYWP